MEDIDSTPTDQMKVDQLRRAHVASAFQQQQDQEAAAWQRTQEAAAKAQQARREAQLARLRQLFAQSQAPRQQAGFGSFGAFPAFKAPQP